MSFRHLNRAYDFPGLNHCEKAVLVYLANRADKLGRCYPGVQDIARRTSLSPSSVHRAKRSLLSKGIVSVVVGGGRGRANVYQLCLGTDDTLQDGTDSCERNPVTLTEIPVKQTQYHASEKVNPAAVTPHTSLTIINHHEPSGETTNGVRAEKDVRTRRQRRAPMVFVVTQHLLAFGRELGLTDDEVHAEIGAFKDHEFANPKSDWEAAARNWLRTAAKRRRSSRSTQSLTYSDRIHQATQDAHVKNSPSEVPRLAAKK